MEITSLLLPLGVIPAIIILYFLIGRYEGKYKEKYIFLTFVGGIVFGTIIILMERISFPSVYSNVLIFSFLFSLVEQLSKFIVLNLKILSDAAQPIYGASLGLGFYSSFAAFFVGEIEINLDAIFLIIFPISALFLSCSLGIILGIGIKRNEKGKYFLISLLLGMVSWIAIIFSIKDIYISSIFSTIYSVAIFYVIWKRYLPMAMLSRKELKNFIKRER